MDLDKTLEFTETYAREYIFYLVEFFFGTPTAENPQDTSTPEGKVVLFAVISAAIGVFLGHKYIENRAPPAAEVMGYVATEFLYWVCLAILLQLILLATRAKPNFVNSLVAVLKALPAAFAASGFAAFVAYYASMALASAQVLGSAGALAALQTNSAYVAAVASELVVCAIYLPTTIHRLHDVGWVRSILSGAVVVLAVALVITGQYFSTVSRRGRENPTPAPSPTAAAAAAADHQAAGAVR